MFITEYSTQTSDNRHATPGSPNNPPKFRPPVSISRDVSPPRDVTPRDVTPQFVDDSKLQSEKSSPPSSKNIVIPIEEQSTKREAPSFAPKSSSPVFSSTSNAIDSRTYAKPPSTPLYRIPKANKSKTSDHSKNIENRTQDPDISKCSIPEENVEVDGSELDTSRTVEVPIHITSPMNSDSVLKRYDFLILFRGGGKLGWSDFRSSHPKSKRFDKSFKLRTAFGFFGILYHVFNF